MIARSIAIGAAVFAVFVVSVLLFLPRPIKPTTAPITTHKQPATGVHAIPPPPIKEAEKEPICGKPAKPETRQTVASATVIATHVTKTATASARTSVISAKGSVLPAPPSVDGTDDPYHDSMLPRGSKWTTTSTTSTTSSAQETTTRSSAPNASTTADAYANAHVINTGPATTKQAVAATAISANRAAMPSAASSTTTPDLRCLTITTDFQQDCATANRWLDDIGIRYGAQMQRHYRWLTAAMVYDWRVNGCSPSPCDANGTGRIQPTDYFGAQGYDSPLGTCHSTTPFRRAGAGRCSQQSDELGCSAPGAMSTLGVLGGTKGDDGKVRGWVRWHGDWYVGMVEDATCTDSCAVGFDHPCDLSIETEQPARRWDIAGKMFYSWWYGGDVNGEPPW